MPEGHAGGDTSASLRTALELWGAAQLCLGKGRTQAEPLALQ